MAKKVFKDVKKFTVVREDWLRGDKMDSQLLRESDSKMCCLGFYAIACGVPKTRIKGEGTPSDCLLNKGQARWDTFLIDRENDPSWGAQARNSKAADDLMRANDDDSISDKERESKLKKLFAKSGVKIKFVNK